METDEKLDRCGNDDVVHDLAVPLAKLSSPVSISLIEPDASQLGILFGLVH